MKLFVKIIAIFYIVIKPVYGGEFSITRLACDELLNGLNITLLSNKMIPLKNVTSWYSPHGWLYVTVNDASFLNSNVDLNSFSNKLLRDIDIINNEHSVQIGFYLEENIYIDEILISRFKHPNLLKIMAYYKKDDHIISQINDKRMLVNKNDNENLEIRRNESSLDFVPFLKEHSRDWTFANPGKNVDLTTVEFIEEEFDGINNNNTKVESHLTYEKDYLKDVLPVDFVQGSFSHSDKYTGTEEQNKALLKTGGFKGYSITDELNAIGVESDFESRKKLYQDTFSSSSVPLSPSLTVAPVIADTFASKLGLEKIDFKHSKQTSNIYIDSNFLGLSVFINRNYVGTTPINNPIELEYGEYKIWCVPPVSERLPNGKTLFYKGNLISFITVETEDQSHFIKISSSIK